MTECYLYVAGLGCTCSISVLFEEVHSSNLTTFSPPSNPLPCTRYVSMAAVSYSLSRRLAAEETQRRATHIGVSVDLVHMGTAPRRTPKWMGVLHRITVFLVVTYAITCKVAFGLLHCPEQDTWDTCHAHWKRDPGLFAVAYIMVVFHVFGFPLVGIFGAERIHRRAQGGSCCRDTKETKDSQLNDMRASESVAQWR